jgi:predicted nuclease with TOPRIM domain
MLELIGADERTRADRRSPQMALDREAKKRIKEKLDELQADLDRARDENNTVEADLTEKEIASLKEQVGRTTGLKGKARDLNNPYDKIRPKIFNQLKKVYAALRQANPPMPQLAEHFELTISSEAGNAFAYRPNSPIPSWNSGL